MSTSKAPSNAHRKISTPSKDTDDAAVKSTSNEKADKIDGDDNTSPVSTKSGDVKKATKSISEGKTGQSNNDVNNDKVKDKNADDSITVDVSKMEKIEGRDSASSSPPSPSPSPPPQQQQQQQQNQQRDEVVPISKDEVKKPLDKEARQMKAISGYIQKQMMARAKKAQDLLEQEAEEKAKKEKRDAAIKKKKQEVSGSFSF